MRKDSVRHYTQKKEFIEPIEICVMYNLNFCQGNLVKYISRCDFKGKYLDLDKALDYLYWACQLVESKNDQSIVSKRLVFLDSFTFNEEQNKYSKFMDQHDEQLKDLLEFANAVENYAYHGISEELIEKTYVKFNLVSEQRFGESLKNNIFYYKYMEILDV